MSEADFDSMADDTDARNTALAAANARVAKLEKWIGAARAPFATSLDAQLAAVRVCAIDECLRLVNKRRKEATKKVRVAMCQPLPGAYPLLSAVADELSIVAMWLSALKAEPPP